MAGAKPSQTQLQGAPEAIPPVTAVPFIVYHDGPKQPGDKAGHRLLRALNNLIHQGRVPPMVASLMVNDGGDARGSQRGLEYDTVSGLFAEFIEAEVLPRVEIQAGVTLTDDPDGQAAMGTTSGGAAAFTMAWFQREWYRQVISFSGTFVNRQWPFDPATPGGAWEYHRSLIPPDPRQLIRLWLYVSVRENFNPDTMQDGMHDWVDASHRMVAVLRNKGYRYL